MSPESLIKVLQAQFENGPPAGAARSFGWGAAAVLREIGRENIEAGNSNLLAWIGDLNAPGLSKGFEPLTNAITASRQAGDSLESDSDLGKLSGAFSVIHADKQSVSIITDHLGYIPVYMATDNAGRILALGTHIDAVAAVSGQDSFDPASAAEYLASGICSFPHTLYRRIKVLEPGSCHIFAIGNNSECSHTSCVYWRIPRQFDDDTPPERIYEQARAAVRAAVTVRCGSLNGVLLSGGLDSRLILSQIPANIKCTGITFGDTPNRETKTAQKAAAAYGRPWLLLYRDCDYIARNVVKTVRLTSAGCEWIHAHTVGFADEILAGGVNAVFNGLQVGYLFRGGGASDIKRIKTWLGLGKPRYTGTDWDYINTFSEPGIDNITPQFREAVTERRRSFRETFAKTDHDSAVHLLRTYPFTQASEISTVSAERKLLPMRFIGADREVLEIAFKCPILLKISGDLYQRGLAPLIGAGCKIPNANNGVRPGSSHFYRIIQRAFRVGILEGERVLKRVGVSGRQVQHSWHDYSQYWASSPGLLELRHRFAGAVSDFDGVTRTPCRQLLLDDGTNWRLGFRLLQLGVWNASRRYFRDAIGTAEEPLKIEP
jgi:hypothetical protein